MWCRYVARDGVLSVLWSAACSQRPLSNGPVTTGVSEWGGRGPHKGNACQGQGMLPWRQGRVVLAPPTLSARAGWCPGPGIGIATQPACTPPPGLAFRIGPPGVPPRNRHVPAVPRYKP